MSALPPTPLAASLLLGLPSNHPVHEAVVGLAERRHDQRPVRLNQRPSIRDRQDRLALLAHVVEIRDELLQRIQRELLAPSCLHLGCRTTRAARAFRITPVAERLLPVPPHAPA